MTQLRKETLALQAGHNTKETQGTRAVPIYQTSSYVFESAEQAANRFNLTEAGYIYTRLNNPTTDVLEQRLAAIEGGIGAVATASGAAAISTALLTLLKQGDHIVASSSLYGGTFNLLNITLKRLGISTTFVDFSDFDAVEKAFKENTKVVFSELIGNPKLDIVDVEKIAEIAHKNEVPYIVDNTIATPALISPIQYGADIVIHSLTKYISGNGTSLGGIIVDAGKFQWDNGKFPEFTEPSPGYHGLVYYDVLKEASFIAKIRIEGLRDLGAAISPFNAFQILQGLETLDIRIKKHSENALKLAQWLSKHPAVASVNYPGLETSEYYDLAKKYFPSYQSGIVTFRAKGGFEAAKKVANEAKLFSLLANIGDSKSLIIHPASTTHQQLSEQDQAATGVYSDLIRLSVGLENIEDLIEDLDKALKIS